MTHYGTSVTFCSGRKTSWSLTHIVIELMLGRQIEIFAGVAASSMPTVKQFFNRQNFSLKSWGLSIKSSLPYLRSSSARVPGGSNTHAAQDHGGLRMKDLESDGYEHIGAKARRAGDSQIRLTQDISVTRE